MSEEWERDNVHTEMIRRPSPLPWLLLLLAIAVAVGAILYGRGKLLSERERTAAALKTSDEAAAKNRELEQRLSQLEGEKKALTDQVGALSTDLSAKEAELDKLQSTYESLEEKMKAEIKRGDIQLSQDEGRIKVDLVDKILFDSGEAELSNRGQEVLGRLANALGQVEDKQIQVSGHTDDAVISERLAAKYATNWELSVARAVNVVRFLAEKAKVPPGRLVAAGHGQYHPVASNATPTGRARNRRIEVLLTPSMQAKPGVKLASSEGGEVKPPPKKKTKPPPKKSGRK